MPNEGPFDPASSLRFSEALPLIEQHAIFHAIFLFTDKIKVVTGLIDLVVPEIMSKMSTAFGSCCSHLSRNRYRVIKCNCIL